MIADSVKSGLFALVIFLVSLLLAMLSSAWFTQRLERICDALALPSSLLSLLGALGANIPNYVASFVAILGGQVGVGLGIIIGSNIYNVAIILSISTFATPKRHGIALSPKQARDARTIGVYALAIMSATLLALWLLPGAPLAVRLPSSAMGTILLFAVKLLTLGLFMALAVHALRHAHQELADGEAELSAQGPFPPHSSDAINRTPTEATSSRPPLSDDLPVGSGTAITREENQTMSPALLRMIGEAVAALALALIAVLFLVQSGQALTLALHIPGVLAGLLVLAVATSLPNTVVAFNLARTDRETACVEEIFSSNSINATLGIALPLLFLFRQAAPGEQLLLLLDGPLMVALTLGLLLLVLSRRISRLSGALLAVVYVAWVVAHIVW